MIEEMFEGMSESAESMEETEITSEQLEDLGETPELKEYQDLYERASQEGATEMAAYYKEKLEELQKGAEGQSDSQISFGSGYNRDLVNDIKERNRLERQNQIRENYIKRAESGGYVNKTQLNRTANAYERTGKEIDKLNRSIKRNL